MLMYSRRQDAKNVAIADDPAPDSFTGGLDAPASWILYPGP